MSVFVEREEQPARVEPRLAAALSNVGGPPAALFGGPGKRPTVYPQQFGVVVRVGVGGDPHARGDRHGWQVGQRTSHLQQLRGIGRRDFIATDEHGLPIYNGFNGLWINIALFTEIGGDRNPLHYDEAAANASRFGEIVVQGGITSVILNAVVAEELPGPGTVFLNVNWPLKAPVRCRDTNTGRVEVIAARTDKPIIELRTTVTRDDGTVVLGGTAVCYTMDIVTSTER